MRMLGAGTIAVLTSAVALPTIPAGAVVAVIQPLAKAVRLRTDGTNPTTAIGRLIAAGETYTLRGGLSTAKLIETEATATVGVTFYG